MKNSNLLILLIAITIATTGCLGSNVSTPQVAKAGKSENGEIDYPSENFLKAVGMGQSEKESQDQAKGELSNIFESRVQSETNTKVKATLEASGREYVEKEIASDIRIISSLTLKGVEIAKTWFDEKERVYKSIAVLDRAKASSIWLGELKNIDEEIEVKLKGVDSIKSKFVRLKTLLQIKKSWLNREVIVSRLKVIGSADASFGAYEAKDIFRKLSDIKNNLTFFVFFKGSDEKQIKESKETISHALSKEGGYIFSKSREKADLVIDGSVAVDKVDLKNPEFEFARATVSLSITDSGTGETVGEIRENERAGHLKYEEAIHKALSKVLPVISTKLLEFLET